jgi:predicted patatin/cPLA2 family phospholipase
MDRGQEKRSDAFNGEPFQEAEVQTSMKIAETYSHLNGLEFLLVHKPKLWEEIQAVISSVDASKCKTKVPKEKTMKGKLLFSPIDMNAAFRKLLRDCA